MVFFKLQIAFAVSEPIFLFTFPHRYFAEEYGYVRGVKNMKKEIWKRGPIGNYDDPENCIIFTINFAMCIGTIRFFHNGHRMRLSYFSTFKGSNMCRALNQHSIFVVLVRLGARQGLEFNNVLYNVQFYICTILFVMHKFWSSVTYYLYKKLVLERFCTEGIVIRGLQFSPVSAFYYQISSVGRFSAK
jgi:hypothetical protein